MSHARIIIDGVAFETHNFSQLLTVTLARHSIHGVPNEIVLSDEGFQSLKGECNIKDASGKDITVKDATWKTLQDDQRTGTLLFVLQFLYGTLSGPNQNEVFLKDHFLVMEQNAVDAYKRLNDALTGFAFQLQKSPDKNSVRWNACEELVHIMQKGLVAVRHK